PNISQYIFNGEQIAIEYIRVIVVSSLLTCLISIYVSFYEMEFKAFRAAVTQLTILIITFCLAFYFIAINQEGIMGALKSILIANLIVFIILFI
ncbi:hypothetical protein CN911_29950, partial [Bacillus thuringiensis]